MSSLYGVHVTFVEERVAKFLVRIVHPDIHILPATKSFALQLVYEPIRFWLRRYQTSIKSSPLAVELDREDMANPTYIQENAGGFIKSVNINKLKNYPPPDFSEMTHDEIQRYFNTSSRQAQGEYTIVASHPAWLSHLQSGMNWDGAPFIIKDVDWKRKPRVPGDTIWVRSPVQKQGFRMILKSTSRMLQTAQIDELKLPCFGAKYYEIEPKLTGDMLYNVHFLLGKPIVLQDKSGCLYGGALIAIY